MKYVILRPMNSLYDTKTRPNRNTDKNSDVKIENNETINYFDDSMYDRSSCLIDNEEDDLEHYQFDTDNMVSYKAATLSGETCYPFAVIKTTDKKSVPCTKDTIYKIVNKRKDTSKDFVSLGFLDVSDKYKPFKKFDNDEIVGIVNEEFVIRKNKGFNKQSIGYLKLKEEDTYKEYYVQLVCNRNWWWLFQTVVITIATIVIIGSIDWNYAKIETNTIITKAYSMVSSAWYSMMETDIIDVSYNRDVYVYDNNISLGVNTNAVDNMEYVVDLYIDNSLIYRSDLIKTGEALDEIILPSPPTLQTNKQNGRLVIKLYKNKIELNDYIEKNIKIINMSNMEEKLK